MHNRNGKIFWCWNFEKNHNDDDCSQSYDQIKEAFKTLTNDGILQPYIPDFRSSIEGDDIGCNLCVFDTQYQKDFKACQPNKVDFKFDAVVPEDIIGYAIVLTNYLVGVSKDEQRFDLIQV